MNGAFAAVWSFAEMFALHAYRACVVPAQRSVIALSVLTAHASPDLTGVYKALNCFVDCQVLRDAVEEKARHREVEQRLMGPREGLGR